MIDAKLDANTKWYDLVPRNIAQKAFAELDIDEQRKIIIKYSGHFKGHNANAHYNHNMVEFSLSSDWKDVDEDIQIGLIQSLIVRINKLRKSTDKMKLYENYLKGLSKYAKKHTHDPVLADSFARVNEKFFNGLMDMPNLIFASENFSKLGSYEYGTDTVYISSIFKDLPAQEKKFLDYVIYHELLHKKHTFNIKNGRHQAHTTAFRLDEKKFGASAEEELTSWLRKKKYASNRTSFRNAFRFW